MGNAGMMCTQTGLDTTTLNAYKRLLVQAPTA